MSAVVSECGTYRYYLTRHSLLGVNLRPVLFIGVNPSTADANADDATIRKMVGFANVWGFDKIVVANVFAYRATDVRKLADAADPVGKSNQHYLESALDECAIVVPCWGNVTKVPRELRQWFTITRIAIRLSECPVRVLGLTKSGDPLHPLMLPYNQELQPWGSL